MTDFAWDPETYLRLMADEVPRFAELQDQLVDATRDVDARTVLELGTGTGETARRVLAEVTWQYRDLAVFKATAWPGRGARHG